MEKKGDEVEDEDDDGVVRTSVSQDRVTVTMYSGINPLHSVYIALPTYQAGKQEREGYIRSTRHTYSWVSHLSA
jgi:hypothetical protein